MTESSREFPTIPSNDEAAYKDVNLPEKSFTSHSLLQIRSNLKLSQVFTVIRTRGTVAKSELIEATHFTSSTLSRILEELTNLEVITEFGEGESTGGRRPKLYSVKPNSGYLIGLDVSRSHSRLVICDLLLNVLDSFEWDMSSDMVPSRFLSLVVESVNHLLQTNNIDKQKVIGMGVGAVGPLDTNKRIMLDAFDFPAEGWRDMGICDYLEDFLQIPVSLDNGACTALRYEHWIDRPHQFRNLVYVHLDIGLRSAIMANGRITSGAIGQIIIQTDGIPSRNPYGNYGALHSYVTIQYLNEQAVLKLKQGRKSLLSDYCPNIDSLTFEDLLCALRDKDHLTTELFVQAGTYFGIGLANVINVLHPEKIVVGGRMIYSNDLFWETAVEVARKKTYHFSPHEEVEFCKAQGGDNALAIGAGVLALDNFLDW